MTASIKTLRTAAMLAIVALVLSAAPAEADCGGVIASYPPHWRHNWRPPLVIGDSTMIFAVPLLAKRRMQANAHGCRQWSEGVNLLRGRLHSHSLPHLVVMALGSNWVITRSDIENTLELIGPGRVLGLVVPLEEGGGTSSDAYNVRRAGRRHRNRVKVLDWPHKSAGHPNWFSGDGLHMSYTGAAAFARMIATLNVWAPPPGRK